MSFHKDSFHQKYNFEVLLTAPQHELSNGTIAMFWYPDQEIEASTKIEAQYKIQRMIENDEIDVDIMDENGDPLTDSEKKEAYAVLEEFDIQPEIDVVRKA